MAMNARFWAYTHGGPVKITLIPGQSLVYTTACTHEEGWSRESTRWVHEGDKVSREEIHDGTDCDGRQTHRWLSDSLLGALSSGFSPLADVEPDYLDGDPATWRGVTYPDWQDIDRSQRDQFAEAAGY